MLYVTGLHTLLKILLADFVILGGIEYAILSLVLQENEELLSRNSSNTNP